MQFGQTKAKSNEGTWMHDMHVNAYNVDQTKEKCKERKMITRGLG